MVRDLFTRETGKRADLPYGLTAVRTYDGVELRIEAEGREAAEDDAPRLRGRKVGVVIRKREYQPGEPIPDGTERVLLDAAAVQGEPVLRRPKQGDAFVVNADGGTKPLGRFFTDRKIPAEERGEYPVVADDAGILWVVGLRLSHHCRIRENTREVYEISAIYDE
jgi:tRNA(Ile)-lysidine synthase